jgi:hypothetical protein
MKKRIARKWFVFICAVAVWTLMLAWTAQADGGNYSIDFQDAAPPQLPAPDA